MRATFGYSPRRGEGKRRTRRNAGGRASGGARRPPSTREEPRGGRAPRRAARRTPRDPRDCSLDRRARGSVFWRKRDSAKDGRFSVFDTLIESRIHVFGGLPRHTPGRSRKSSRSCRTGPSIHPRTLFRLWTNRRMLLKIRRRFFDRRKEKTKRSELCFFTRDALRYAPPLMRAMSASCSALTRSSDSYSTCRRSSSRRRSRAAADFTAESRRRRSDSAAAWLRLPTARSFSRSVSAAFRVARHEVRRRRRSGAGIGSVVGTASERETRGAASERFGPEVLRRGLGERSTRSRDRSGADDRDAPVGPPRPPRWRPYR